MAHQYEIETKEKAVQVAIEIENILKLKFRDNKAYSDKARSILYNMRDQKNPTLKVRALMSDISPMDLVTLGPKDLASELKKQERVESEKQNLDSRRSDWNREEAQKNSKNQGFFSCRKCGKRNTTYYQMQTRGADEPMTNFITCLDCGNNWKS